MTAELQIDLQYEVSSQLEIDSCTSQSDQVCNLQLHKSMSQSYDSESGLLDILRVEIATSVIDALHR